MVFNVRPGLALCDLTPWELLGRLEYDGWVLKKAAKKKRAALVPYRPGGRKVWYLFGTTLTRSRCYMECLLDVDQLFTHDVVVQVPHGESEKYYAKLHAGKVSGVVGMHALEDGQPPPAALEDDVDGDLFDQAAAPLLALPPNNCMPSDAEESAGVLTDDVLDSDSVVSDVGSDHSEQSGAGDLGPDVSESLVVNLGADGGGDGAGMASGGGDGAHPPPPQPHPAGRAPRQYGYSESFRWGQPAPAGFHFLFSTVGMAYGRWQVTCPYHRLNQQTPCTRSKTVHDAEGKQRFLLLLKQWCLKASWHERRRHHKDEPLVVDNCLPEEVMDINVFQLQPPPSPDSRAQKKK